VRAQLRRDALPPPKPLTRKVASLGVAVGAAEVEEVLIEEREHVLGEVSRVDGDRGEPPLDPDGGGQRTGVGGVPNDASYAGRRTTPPRASGRVGTCDGQVQEGSVLTSVPKDDRVLYGGAAVRAGSHASPT